MPSDGVGVGSRGGATGTTGGGYIVLIIELRVIQKYGFDSQAAEVEGALLLQDPRQQRRAFE